jgi:hypothetical protein
MQERAQSRRRTASTGTRGEPRAGCGVAARAEIQSAGRPQDEGGRLASGRNAQFEHINAKAAEYLRSGQPTISVDTKKKEQAGDYKNGGREWRPKGQPELVEVHDFAKQKDIPYGVYDPGQNADWVSVGTDRDTSAFAFKAGWTQANTRKGSRWASRSLPPFNCAPTLPRRMELDHHALVLNATVILL